MERSRKERVGFILDATKKVNMRGLEFVLHHICQPSHTLTLLGILHRIPNPNACKLLQTVDDWRLQTSLLTMVRNTHIVGYMTIATTSSFNGTNEILLGEALIKETSAFENKLALFSDACVKKGVSLNICITAGYPLKSVVLQKASSLDATIIILDRNLRSDKKIYGEVLSCNVLLLNKENKVEVLRRVDQDWSLKAHECMDKDCNALTMVSELPVKKYATSTDLALYIPTIVTMQRPSMGIEFKPHQISHPNGESKHIVKEKEVVDVSLNSFRGAMPLCSLCNQDRSSAFVHSTRIFRLHELNKATDDFSLSRLIVSNSSLGLFYKGVLEDGEPIAVKMLKVWRQQGDEEQYRAEIDVLGHARNHNVVTLLGYCLENGHCALVYEYICNESLDFHLSYVDSDFLPWPTRNKIALGVARGLCYLHEECQVGCIVHCNVRANNILLTHDFTAMVGDFGVARLQWNRGKHVDTKLIKSIRYIAPEYAETGEATDKSDVYAFGVLLLELISGRKISDLSLSSEKQNLAEWASSWLHQHEADDSILDPRIVDTVNRYEMSCLTHAASLCIQKQPSKRPRMSQVVHIIEGGKIQSRLTIPNHPCQFDAIASFEEIKEEKDVTILHKNNYEHLVDATL